MADPASPEEKRLESVYGSMIEALARRDLAALDSLMADDIELRSYAIGPDVAQGKRDALAAVRATRHRMYNPMLLSFEHLGDGWMIVAGRLRHTDEGGGMADSTKAALVQVVGSKVQVSLATSSPEKARAEYEARRAGER